MNSDVHPVKKYEDSLVDLWFKNKTEYYFKFKRNIERTGTTGSHRIAFDYSHIRLDYRFYDNNDDSFYTVTKTEYEYIKYLLENKLY